MFTTLYGKLAAVLLGLLCLIGGLYIFLTMMTTRLYDQEVTQKLNRLWRRIWWRKICHSETGTLIARPCRTFFTS